MPFGIRNASLYIEKHRALMLDHRASNCHCCNKEVLPDEQGRSKLAATRFAYLSNGEGDERRALLCEPCYMKQLKLKFNTLEEFIEHHGSKQRLPRVVSKPYKTKSNPTGEKKPVTPKVRKSLSLENIDREFLVELHRMLGEYLERGATDLDANSGMAEFLDEDDLLAGMTDEQRLMMDAAVAVAEERTKQVPQEVPNGW